MTPDAVDRASMPRVLVLSAPYGAGHARVAEAVATACEAEGATVEVADHFARFVSPAFARASLGLFWLTLRRAPALWGWAYALSARMGNRSPWMGGMDRLGARGLARHLLAAPPDLVVHVHPTPAGALAWLRARGVPTPPHGIVLTDLVAHPQWIYAGLDRYFVPAERIRTEVAARGVPADRVVASGIPIEPGFAAPPDRAALRRELGLDPATPTVLVTSGMRGALGGLTEACRVLTGLDVPFQAVVLGGDHRGLSERLARDHGSDRRFRVLGRVANMPRVMGAADLVVTKAGAVTTAEALALELPLVFFRSLPGQERANERFLEEAGAGVRAPTPEALARTLRALLADRDRWLALAAAARRLRRPEAAQIVAKEMLALARREPA